MRVKVTVDEKTFDACSEGTSAFAVLIFFLVGWIGLGAAIGAALHFGAGVEDQTARNIGMAVSLAIGWLLAPKRPEVPRG